MRRSLIFTLSLVAAPLFAQRTPHTISPGMNKAQVIAALGEPAALRSVSEFTYVFYNNACGKRCGMHDIIVLRADSVVDAIFRSPDRHYTGVSSSPAAIPQAVARKMKPGPANDTRPSIPTNPPDVRPRPTPKPTSKSP